MMIATAGMLHVESADCLTQRQTRYIVIGYRLQTSAHSQSVVNST
jgi:hypothetical protein